MNNFHRPLLKFFAMLSVVSILGGCAASQVAISKRNLDVQTRTSTSIFVDPAPKNMRTIYLDVKSGVMEFDRNAFRAFVKQKFEENANGYTITDDPDAAQFQMIAYVLNLEKTSPTAAEAALGKGYLGGAAAGGAAAGALISGGGYNSRVGAAAGGALLAGGAEFISSAFVKDVTYMLVADIQIKEKTRSGAVVRKDSQIDTKVSDAGSARQTVSELSYRKEYRTRVVTTANKVNLKLEDAQELMFQKTAYALAGFF